MTSMLNAALKMVAQGWPIFPCSQNDKRPLVGESKPGARDAGLYRATTDEPQIHAWWGKWQDAMLGLTTGVRLGAFVVDFDPKAGATPAAMVAMLEMHLGVKLPPAPICRTPRGGWHMYFRMPEGVDIRNRANLLGAGKGESMIDIRGTGGYVIAPPSVRQGGKAVQENCAGVAYAWLDNDAVKSFDPPLPPQELIDLILRQGKFAPQTSPTPRAAPSVANRVEAYALKAFAAELKIVRGAPDGHRNDLLNIAALKLGHLVGAGALDEDIVVAALEKVASAWPNFRKSQGTIQSGLGAGKAEPADLSKIGTRTAERRRKPRSPSGDGGGERGGADVDPRPLIHVLAGEHSLAAEEAEAVLRAEAAPLVFQKGGALVHTGTRPARRCDGGIDVQEAIVLMNVAALGAHLSRTCRFEKWNVKADDFVACDPPARVVEALHSRAGWRLPDLHQIIAVPTLRPDGSLIEQVGYDATTGIYLSHALPGLRLLAKPTRDDALRADEVIAELFRDFPFAGRDGAGGPDVSLAVVKAALLTALVRHLMPHAPFTAISAPAAGTGKSYLVDVIAIIVTGRRASTMGVSGDKEEFRKALTAALLEGRPILSLDNLTAPLGGPLLCRVITQERTQERIMGLSRMVDLPTAVSLFATGNNLRILDDMARRTLLCHMDSGQEHPEEREFPSDLLEEAQRRRAELVSAGLTILRWALQQRPPAPSGTHPLAGFEVWTRLVRDPLMALGTADPAASIAVVRASDPARAALAQFLAAWCEMFGDDSLTAGDAIRRVSVRDQIGDYLYPDHLDAFLAVGAMRGVLNARRLGNFMSGKTDTPADGLCIRRAGERARAVLWRVAKR